MKTSKSPVSTEVTPSKKKLKQARLPFMLISDVSPKPAEQQTRKRKLSTPQPEPVTKIGKLSKENDLSDDLVVISDDESKNEEVPKVERQMNPFVKLVDNAWKKKQQKSKKKKKPSKKKGTPNETTVTNNSECDEEMDVDVPSEKKEALSSGIQGIEKSSPEKAPINTSKETVKKSETSKNEEVENISETIDLNVSNDSSAQSMVDNKTASIKTEEKVTNVDKNNTKMNEDDTQSHTIVSDSDEKDTEISKVRKSVTSDNGINDTLESDKEEKNTKPIQKSDESETSIVKRLTPKRLTKSRLEAKNESNSSTTLNESVSTPVSTPKHSRSSSATNSQGNDSMNDSTANLTPKQLQKRLESAKKKEEREKEKQEREKKKQQDKEEKAKQRLEKEEQRKKEREEKEEAKKKEKEEKEEHKRKEREEKEKQKEMERKLKEEKEDQKRKEREEKEEQKKKEKEAKEEEKRKKQEALELEKQEQELKKKKAAEAFVNFFVPKQKVDKDPVSDGPVSKNSMLSSFTIKGDMRLAPTVRVDLTDEKRQGLDDLMEQQNIESLYLKNLKDGSIKPISSGRTWPMDDKDDDDDDVMIIEDELPLTGAGEIITCEPAVREKLHPKLLSFHENRRPPYWGTWRKKSAVVKPRKPFGQDNKQLDYEVDSDEEWEEEQEGESIDGSAAGSDEEQDADEYEVDNEVFVPHGYLSDEEATMGEDDVVSFSPETQKARLKDLEDEFESEMKKPTEKLKPRLYGLIWENSDGGKPENCIDALWEYFGKLAMIMNDPTPLLEPSKEPEEAEKKKVKKKKAPKKEGEEKTESPKVEKKKKSKADKDPKTDTKKNIADVKKNQPDINSFLTKLNQNK